MRRTSPASSALLALACTTGLALHAAPVAAQPLGTFSWQLQPYCNRVTVSVRQDGAVYTLDGTDDQCGTAQKAPLVGLAALNPDGSIAFGLNIVAPSGQPVPVQARINFSTLSGTWRDSAGNTGAFVFGAALPGLPPRPSPTAPGDITAVTTTGGLTGGGTSGDIALGVDSAVLQRRVSTSCPAGEALQAINQDGTAVCQAGTGGDVTAVNPGAGLTGGGTAGDVTLHAIFGGDGTANAAARADHEHVALGSDSVGVGPGALLNIIAGDLNTAVGAHALEQNVGGDNNTAVGRGALRLTTGSSNTAAGAGALDVLVTGNANTALGRTTLGSLTSGSGNTAIGIDAGTTPTTATDLTLIGRSSNAASALTNATAIGARAQVDQNNALVLGGVAGVNGAVADTDVGIGTTTPGSKLNIVTTGVSEMALRVDHIRSSGSGRTISGTRARGTRTNLEAVQAGDILLNMVAFGYTGTSYTGGASMQAEAAEAYSGIGTGGRWSFSTVPNGSQTPEVRLRIDHDGEIGIGTSDPQARLHVAGTVRVDTLGAAGVTTLCRNASNNQIATCSSSLRYKRDLRDFKGGLDVASRLRPISFTWKDGGLKDVGFGAEDVAAIDPRLAVFNPDGTVEGVKYDRLTAVLVNAVKELNAQNDALAAHNAELERRLAALERALQLDGDQRPAPLRR